MRVMTERPERRHISARGPAHGDRTRSVHGGGGGEAGNGGGRRRPAARRLPVAQDDDDDDDGDEDDEEDDHENSGQGHGCRARYGGGSDQANGTPADERFCG